MNVDKATRYHQLRRRAELAGTALAGLVLLGTMVSGLGLWVRDAASHLIGPYPPAALSIGGAALLAAALTTLIAIVEAPLAWYQGFVLEHRYALATQTAAHWWRDHLKATVIAAIVAMLGGAVVYAAVALSVEWWWLISAFVFALAAIVIVELAPVALLPLFYKFRPLERPALVERLRALAGRADTTITGVFEWCLSGHTRKANAALAGMGRTRRILLSDTLLQDYSDDEIEVVLAHELAHHVHHDLWRAVALQIAVLLGGFFAAHLALAAFEGRLGLSSRADPAGLPLLMLVGGIWSALLVPAANAFSRAAERRADRYALETTRNAQAFVSAMRRLAQQNLAEDRPSTLVQWLFYSHPPIRERIRAAEEWARREQAGPAQPAIAP